MVTVFHAPATGALITPWVNRLPGCPLESVNTPSTTVLAVLAASRYADIWVAVPPAPAVALKASAIPAELLSCVAAIVAVPTSAVAFDAGLASKAVNPKANMPLERTLPMRCASARANG